MTFDVRARYVDFVQGVCLNSGTLDENVRSALLTQRIEHLHHVLPCIWGLEPHLHFAAARAPSPALPFRLYRL